MDVHKSRFPEEASEPPLFQNPTITHKAVGPFLSWPETKNVFGLVKLEARNAKSIQGLWFLVWLLGDLGA